MATPASSDRALNAPTGTFRPSTSASYGNKVSAYVESCCGWLQACNATAADQSNVLRKAAAAGTRKDGDAGIDRSLAVHEEPLHQLALADRRVSEQDDFDAVSRGGAR